MTVRSAAPPTRRDSEGVSAPVCGRADKRNSTIYYVKRIIGMPGDTIDIKDGHVYLNGSDTRSEEPYLHEEMEPKKNFIMRFRRVSIS